MISYTIHRFRGILMLFWILTRNYCADISVAEIHQVVFALAILKQFDECEGILFMFKLRHSRLEGRRICLCLLSIFGKTLNNKTTAIKAEVSILRLWFNTSWKISRIPVTQWLYRKRIHLYFLLLLDKFLKDFSHQLWTTSAQIQWKTQNTIKDCYRTKKSSCCSQSFFI